MKYRQNIYLLYAISFLQGLVFYGPVATLYRQAAGVSVFEITIIESISLVLCIALEMPWGILADRIGYKNTMIISCVVYFLSKAVFWKADGFGGFLLERVMLSVVMAGVSGCDISILYLSSKEGESQKVFGIYQSLSMAGLLTASLTYSLLIGENYRLAGFLTMVFYGIAAILAFGLKEVKDKGEKKKRRSQFFHTFLEVMRDRYFLLGMVGITFLEETNQTITVFLNQLQYVKCGITPRTMGLFYILVTAAGMTGMWSFGLKNKMGTLKTGCVLFLLSCLSCLILYKTNSGALSVLCMVALRLAASLFAPLKAELQNGRITSAERATVLSIYAVIGEAAGVGTNLLFGRAAAANLSYAMLCGAMLTALGCGLFVGCRIREGRVFKTNR